MNPDAAYRVLYTRPEPTPVFERMLREGGCAVHRVPLIRIAAPESWDALDASLARLDSYAGVLLTSRQSVRWFLRGVDARGIDRAMLPPLHAVGTKTAEEAIALGLTVQELPSASYGSTLAAELPDVEGKLFLQPCTDIARTEIVDTMRERGGDVEQVVVYRTLPASDEAMRELQELNRRGFDAVAFFSPSAVRQFATALEGWRQSDTAVAVIGDTTADTAREHGLRVDIVAREQTAESLANGILEPLHPQTRHPE